MGIAPLTDTTLPSYAVSYFCSFLFLRRFIGVLSILIAQIHNFALLLIVDRYAQGVKEEGGKTATDYQTTTFVCDDDGRARRARAMSDSCNKKRKQSSADNFLSYSALWPIDTVASNIIS